MDHYFKFLTREPGSSGTRTQGVCAVCALCFRLALSSLCSGVLCEQIGLFMWKVLVATIKKEFTVVGISPVGFIFYWE